MVQKINIGNQSNDGTGDSIREAFRKTNENFAELYGVAGLSGGLAFTKLQDTPKVLYASTSATPTVIVVDNYGSTLTQKRLVAGSGIAIINTASNYITISNVQSSLLADPNPQLGGNLNSNFFKLVNVGDPLSPYDGVNKRYVDANTFYSAVNLYVSTTGSDSFAADVPPEKRGRSLAFAFRTINYACQVAETIISTATQELSVYQQFLTKNSEATTATVYDVTATPGIVGDTRVRVNVSGYAGTDQYIGKYVRSGQYLLGQQSGTIAFIDNVGLEPSGLFEFYDVKIKSSDVIPAMFIPGEPLLFAAAIPKKNITIFVESGIYEEHLPIRVPTNTSIRGDEFRRVSIRPRLGVSQSKWANLFFRRDDNFDGMSRSSNYGQTNLAPAGQPFGYHYLTNPSDITSTPKSNDTMDVFLMNDASILRAINCQGHGGFMCVLDPEGQILTKSPYMQNCTSFTRSTQMQQFAGGIFVDGFAGNLQVIPVDQSTYFLGTTTINITNLPRQPQTPNAFFVKGNRYQVNYITTTTNSSTFILNLNTKAAGGIAYANGTIPIASGGGSGYSIAPTVVFDSPSVPGGTSARGTANLTGGAVTSISISNPGSGYTGTVSVQFIGGNPVTPATTFVITGTNIRTGFIGSFTSGIIELGTAGNKSMLSADFTQVNDLGYGLVTTNNGLQECVSDFTYYCQSGYYSANGGQIRSLNGSCGYGVYALQAAGADPNEIPIPVFLSTDIVQTATVVNFNYVSVGGVNTVNTTGSTAIFIKGQNYTPYNQCELEVDHGSATDLQGNPLGITIYSISSVSTLTNTATVSQGVVQLTLAGGLVQGAGLKAPISSGTSVTIRSSQVLQFTGVNAATITRPSTALVFFASSGTTYRVLSYDSANLVAGNSKVTLRDPYNYLSMQTYGTVPINTTTVKIFNLSTDDANRINYYQGSTSTQMTFAWKGTVHRITAYRATTATLQAWAEIDIAPATASTITNAANTGTTLLKAGARQYAGAEITTRISTLRATGHDMLNIGSGSFDQSRYPNDIFGPPDNKPASARERVEIGKGRVFAVTSDQDGNFKVGDLFQVDQGSGNLTISGSLGLSSIDSLGFKRGTTIREFSVDDTMARVTPDAVPTEYAVVNYINHRLGLTQTGASASRLGSGYLDLTGTQNMAGSIKMSGNLIDMGNAGITNVTITSSTNALNATNKAYVDVTANAKIAIGGTSSIDPISGTSTSYLGRMTGPLQLNADPVWWQEGTTAVTKRYVDRNSRQVSTLNDVQFGVQTTNNGVVNLPQDQHILMFSATTATVNTGTATTIWTATRQIINVGLSTSSHVWFSRTGNTLTMTVNTGTIIDGMVSDSAAIQQKKLSMGQATVGNTSSGITQTNLGLARFDSAYFVDGGNGWITLKTPLSLTANVAAATAYTLTRGNYLTGSDFNGSAATTWAVDAATSNTAGKVVARDSSGNFSAGTISAGLTGDVNGIANCAKCMLYDTSNYAAGSTGTNASTFVVRDGNCNVWAKTFIGIATCANYADLAEKYRADAKYLPCTVLKFGGSCEVTIATDSTRRVAGVVSTNPAHTMNSALEGENVVTLALTGRVPTKVKGPVRKGDMMVAADDGYARSEPDPVMGSVIGKALEDFDGESGVIEIVVGRL